MSAATDLAAAAEIGPMAAVAAADDAASEPRTVVMAGRTFTLRNPCPQGALATFSMRLGDKNPMVQTASFIKLMRAWIVPEQHDEIDDMMDEVVDLAVWAQTDLAKLVEAATARPT